MITPGAPAFSMSDFGSEMGAELDCRLSPTGQDAVQHGNRGTA